MLVSVKSQGGMNVHYRVSYVSAQTMDHESATYSAVWAVVNAVGGLTSFLLFFDDAAMFLTGNDRTGLARVAAFIFNRSRESRTHVA